MILIAELIKIRGQLQQLRNQYEPVITYGDKIAVISIDESITEINAEIELQQREDNTAKE